MTSEEPANVLPGDRSIHLAPLDPVQRDRGKRSESAICSLCFPVLGDPQSTQIVQTFLMRMRLPVALTILRM